MKGVNQKQLVKLEATDVENPQPVEFPILTALELLNLPKSAWKLADKDYTYKGKELIKKKTETLKS